MDSVYVKTKKISLFLLIIIVLFVIALIFTIINIFSSSSAVSENEKTSNQNLNLELSINSDQENSASSSYNIIDDFADFTDISNTEQIFNDDSSDNALTLNNHTFTFEESVDASIISDSNTSALQILNQGSDSKIILNIDNSINFETLKSTPSLRNYLETKYNISITSDVKSGKIQNLNVILFTISDNNGVAYFVITPLNDSEVIYSKIYNKSDMSNLINDLSKPIDEISSIITNSIN